MATGGPPSAAGRRTTCYGVVFRGVVGAEMLGGVEWWLVVVGTGVWLLAMTHFGWRHRGFLRELQERSREGDEEPV